MILKCDKYNDETVGDNFDVFREWRASWPVIISLMYGLYASSRSVFWLYKNLLYCLFKIETFFCLFVCFTIFGMAQSLYTHFLFAVTENLHVNQSDASAPWQVRIVYSNWSGDWEQSTVNVWIHNEVFMRNTATLSSILKKHYTHLRRKVEMLTFMLRSVRTVTQACTHIYVHAHTHPQTEKQRHNSTYFFSSLT